MSAYFHSYLCGRKAAEWLIDMKEQILELLESIRPDVDFQKEQHLIDDEILESFDVIQIVTTLMDEFDIYIDADDIEPENLNNLDAICALVEQKKSEA